MTLRPHALRPHSDPGPADWLVAAGREVGFDVVRFGPPGYASYARVRRSGDDHALLSALVDVLGRHTTTPDHAWIGLWDGHDAAVPAARFALPHRDYYLCSGALRDLGRWDEYPERGRPEVAAWMPVVPELWWPSDRRWFVAADVDSEGGDDARWWLTVGGPQSLIDELHSDDRFDVVHADPYRDQPDR